MVTKAKQVKAAPAATPSAITAMVAAATQAPAAPAKQQAVAVRGGLVVTAVKVGGKPCRSKAPHNVAWAEVVFKLLAGKQSVPVADVVAAGVPVTHIGYMVRSGWLASA